MKYNIERVFIMKFPDISDWYIRKLSIDEKRKFIYEHSVVLLYKTFGGKKVPKYINTYITSIEDDGAPYMAVLTSPRYGDGFSTETNYPEIAYDKRIVEFWLNRYDDESLTEIELLNFYKGCGYELEFCYKPLNTFRNLNITFIPLGIGFYIDNHNGAESIITEQNPRFIIASDKVPLNWKIDE